MRYNKSSHIKTKGTPQSGCAQIITKVIATVWAWRRLLYVYCQNFNDNEPYNSPEKYFKDCSYYSFPFFTHFSYPPFPPHTRGYKECAEDRRNRSTWYLLSITAYHKNISQVLLFYKHWYL